MFDAVAHEIDEVGAAAEIDGVRVRAEGGHRRACAGGALVGERSHLATCRMAATMPG